MTRVGNEEAGFSVDRGAFAVRVRAWGFWDGAIAAKLVPTIAETLRAGSAAAPLLIDAMDLKPQSPEGQAALAALVQATGAAGVARVEFATANALTRMQVARILRETHAKGWTIVSAPVPSAAAGGT